MEKGTLQEKKRLAMQLLPIMDEPTIARMTELPLDEVTRLRQENR